MQNMIQARNVRRCFRVSGNDFWALKGVDMDVPAGALAIGRVRQEIKEGWSDDRIAFKADKK